MKKRLLSILLALAMVLTLMPGTVRAAADSDFTIVDDVLTKYNGPGGNVVVPNGVTIIGDYAFDGSTSLNEVVIPDSVTSMGKYVFRNCNNLKSVVLPNTTGLGLFEGCSNLITAGPIGGDYDIQFPQSDIINLSSIIYSSSVQQVVIPDGTVSVTYSSRAFPSSLNKIIIPNSVKFVDVNEYQHLDNGLKGLFDQQLLLETAGPISGDYDIQFGWTDEIPECAFANACINQVDLPDGITHIGACAFDRCTDLAQIVIPSSVTYIGDYAFRECGKLTDIAIPDGVIYINRRTFSGCIGLTNVAIPSSVKRIDSYAFSGCTGLTDVYYSGSESEWASIDIETNNECLTNATIHYNSTGPSQWETKNISGVLRSTEAGDILWEYSYQINGEGVPRNGRIDITMNNSNQTGELYLYNGSGAAQFPWELEPYNIPKSAITKVVIMGPLAGPRFRITANSFQGYDKLQTLVLDQVSGIDSYAFEGCTSLEKVSRWDSDEDLARIGKGAFKNCTNLAEMNFSGVTTIGDGAFQNTPLGEIQLHKGITEIGSNAFADCADVLICCYEGSYAHQYAQENNIPFKLIVDAPSYIEIPSGAGAPEKFTHNLDYFVTQTNSTTYNAELSHMMITLCNAVHDESTMLNAMTSLGFYNGVRCEEKFITFNIAKKQTDDGAILILVVVRGTDGFWEWASNFNLIRNSEDQHKGFADAANEIYKEIVGADILGTEDFSNVKFVITGHSRGAAAANLLETKLLGKGVAQKDLYGYNFACPDVSVKYDSEWNPSGKYNNMFNIGNASDPISLLPGVAGDTLTNGIKGIPNGKVWGKFGVSRWFSKDWSSLAETSLDFSFSAHGQNVYLENLRQRPSFSTFKTWGERLKTVTDMDLATIGIGKLLDIFCPVDVLIEDSTGNPVASVIDGNVNYYDSEFGKVLIFTDEDRKAIYVQGNDPLTIHLTATDNGAMEYTVQTVDLNIGEILSEKSFAEVALIPDKQMLSLTDVEEITGVGEDVSRVPLYVLGDDDQPELKVLPDGQGTEIPLDAIAVIFDANGGSMSTASIQTGTDGKLASWPTPTRTGYTFNGWFISSSGGTPLAADAVFTEDTTVYAQWTAASSNPDPTPGPNNPVGPTNPGGSWNDYTPTTTYTITTLTTPNGTVTVSPKSASKGSTVTITATPDTGYQLTTLTVTDNNGKEVSLTDKGSGAYAFTMPGGKVSINAVFQPMETSWSNPFTDVSTGAWYYDAVKFVSENGLMNGVGNGLFAPEANLSRGMLTQILYNKEGQPAATDNSTFTDVNPGAWYSVAVSWASKKGIVGGYGNGLFGPNDNITREQLAVMLWRYAGKPVPPNLLLNFIDANLVSDYAMDAMRWAVDKGIINGKGNGILDPRGYATRAEAAQMLKNYLTQ